jgi:DNA helicase IV
MKNNFKVLIACLLITLAFVGCTNKEKQKENATSPFKAIILEIDENSVLVQPLDSENETNSSDKISFNIKNLNKKVLNYEDSALFIYLKFLLTSIPYKVSTKLVVIDEAQDYTLLQYKIIKSIFKNANFTILGDINQTINPYYKYDNLDFLAIVIMEKRECIATKKILNK